MVVIAASIGILLLLFILGPFFWGPGGLLQEASSINSPAKLAAFKEAILQRYLEDEASFSQGSLSKLAWDKRRQFLVNRYIDTARRLDFVAGQEAEAKSTSPSQEGAS